MICSKLKAVCLLMVTLQLLAVNGAEEDKLLGRAYSNREKKMHFWNSNHAKVKSLPSISGSRQDCSNGEVVLNNESFPCRLIDFESFIGIPDLLITRENYTDVINELADIWGWLSPSGKEISIVCMTNGIRFIDGTDPVNPINLAYLPSNRLESYWCDVKVYENVAYIVKDRMSEVEPGKGIQIFNLTRLEELSGENNEVTEDLVYTLHGSSHNVVVNTETGFIYTVGNRGDDCEGGLHMINVSAPLDPKFVGCAGEDQYVHDAQCVVYTGPDTKYFGRELCFGFNEDTLTIYDVENKSDVTIISKSLYDNAEYTHQGWLTTDMTTVLIDDELDEYEGTVPTTRTYIMNVSNLENPEFKGFYNHLTPSIDHNLYIWGAVHANGWGGNAAMGNPPDDSFAYCANYASGVRVLDIDGVQNEVPAVQEVGYFDVSPDIESSDFFGSWSTYMHPSGMLAVSGIERGLFILSPRMAFGMPPTVPTLEPSPFPTPLPTGFPTPFPTPNPTDGTASPTEESGLGFSTEEIILVAIVSGTVVILLVFAIVAFRGIKLTAPKTGKSISGHYEFKPATKAKDAGAISGTAPPPGLL
mmetsp:Transcript_13789/g.17988  ORF Transcript_13789/g.17988 Transcript_13789/m.17988 type:complete len:586 (-) Transcript_13789:1486-3243(-)|eukprot:CAMPEP_0184012924 /NCGR_PEP_ID=MMETSP0954-20121128/4716_1 /TAXON_ID=627963 /ORGANISM="Aplanochytrium sp, Strain PBS07" /LENGTH=585 /DNA_ID=CAMNT_0026293033 /DNA_START=99 /DNA_END=1856 /DNA_ORIENTATION=-